MRRLWRIVSGEQVRPAVLLGLAALATAAMIATISHRVESASPTELESGFARLLQSSAIWAAACWALFTLTLRFDGWSRSHRRQLASAVFLTNAVLTLPLYLRINPLDPSWQEYVAYVQTAQGAWAILLLIWATYNLVICWMSAGGEDARGLLLLILSSVLVTLGSVYWALSHWSDGFGFEAPVGEGLVVAAGLVCTVVLSKYGVVPPFQFEGVRADVSRSGLVILVVTVAYMSFLVLSVPVSILASSQIVMTLVLVVVSHSLLDAHWRARAAEVRGHRIEDLERQIEAVNAEAAVAEARERQRILRELHHHVLGRLSLVSTSLERLSSSLKGHVTNDPSLEDISDALRELARSVGRLGGDSRAIVSAIYPSELMQGDLYHALQQLGGLALYRVPFSSVDVGGLSTIRDLELPPTVAREMYFLVMEGLNNAAKHMPGSVVEVGTELEDNDLGEVLLRVWVRSAAPQARRWLSGFVARTLPKVMTRTQGGGGSEALGIASMREAFRALGGDVELEVQPRFEVRLVGWLPLRIRSDHEAQPTLATRNQLANAEQR